jgi:hypothetical protein
LIPDAAISLTSPFNKEELVIWKKLRDREGLGPRPFHRHRLTFAVTSLNARWLAFSSTFALDWTSPDLFEFKKFQMICSDFIFMFIPIHQRNNDPFLYLQMVGKWINILDIIGIEFFVL